MHCFSVKPRPCPFWYGAMIPVQTPSVFWKRQVRHLLPWWYLIVLTQMWGCHGNCIHSSWEVVLVFFLFFFLSAEKASEAPSWLLLAALQWLSFQGCFIIHRLRDSPFWSCSGETGFLLDRRSAFPMHQTCHRHTIYKLRHLQSLFFLVDGFFLKGGCEWQFIVERRPPSPFSSGFWVLWLRNLNISAHCIRKPTALHGRAKLLWWFLNAAIFVL